MGIAHTYNPSPPEAGGWGEEGQKFKANLGYRSLYLKKKKVKAGEEAQCASMRF